MKLHIDFESRSVLDLKQVGSYVYANHPSTEVMAFAYAFDNGPILVSKLGDAPPKDVIEYIKNGGKAVAHNAYFELLIWNYCWRRYFPDLPELSIKQMDCTMIMAYAMGVPGSLEKAAPAMGISTEKDMKGQRVMLQLSQPKEIYENGRYSWYSPIDYKDKYERMYDYCKQDVEVERQLYPRLLSLSHSEREMWEIDYTINSRGVSVDLPSAICANSIISFEAERLNKKIREITKNEVATYNANKQFTDWINSRGVKTEGVAKSDITELLEKDLPTDVRLALELRREAAKSSTAKVEALINRTSDDNRMRFTMQFYGAGTGRWAGRGFQVHNLPRPKLKKEEIENIFEILK